VCRNAALKGCLQMLQWLRAQDQPCPWDGSACTAAAERGHWQVVRWLLQQEPPCPCSAETRQLASEHLDIAALQEVGEVKGEGEVE